MTKKIHSILLACSLAFLLCLAPVYGNIEGYNPNNDHAATQTDGPKDETVIREESAEEKALLKDATGDFNAHDIHSVQKEKAQENKAIHDYYTQHGDLESHPASHTAQGQPLSDKPAPNSAPAAKGTPLSNNPAPQQNLGANHHENTNNPHNMIKSRNPLHPEMHVEDGSDIREIQVKFDGKEHHLEALSCTYVKIPVHHGNVDVHLKPLGNACKAMVTVTPLRNCAQLKKLQCPEHTPFCEVHELMGETDIKLYHEIADAEWAFLYILPHDMATEVAFSLKVNNIEAIHLSQDVHEAFSHWEDCYKFDSETCQQTADPCKSKCMYSMCAVDNQGDRSVIAGHCVPTGYNNDTLHKYCTYFPEFYEAKESNRSVLHPNCSPYGLSGSVQGAHSHSFITLAFAGFFFIFMCVVCIYRYQFRKYGAGCFDPPSWCPRSLFPSRYAEMSNPFYKDVMKHQELQMEYQPPVL